MMFKVYVFLKRSWITFTTYKMQLAMRYASLFVGLTFFYFFSQLMDSAQVPQMARYGNSVARFILVGVVFQSVVSISLGSFSASIRNEQMMGTLEFLLMSNTPLLGILFMNSLWSFVRAILNTALVFLVVTYVFKIYFAISILPALLVLIFSILALSGIGLMSAGMILAFKQGDPVTWIFSMLSALLSGVLFPVEILPPFLRGIANFLPTTHALMALRKALILGAGFESIAPHLLALDLFAMVTLPLGFLVSMWGFSKALQEGSLAQY
jgi:ABC-2 type transport system permease protein